MKIAVNIPDQEWYLIAGKAERAGVKISDIIGAAVRSLVADNPQRVVLRDQVQTLVEKGIPDIVISHRTHVGLDHVRKVRRELGLQPVKFRREDWEQELAS